MDGREEELTELRALRQRIVDLTNEAWSMSQQPVGLHEAQRYAAIASALTILLDPKYPPSGARPSSAVHLTE